MNLNLPRRPLSPSLARLSRPKTRLVANHSLSQSSPLLVLRFVHRAHADRGSGDDENANQIRRARHSDAPFVRRRPRAVESTRPRAHVARVARFRPRRAPRPRPCDASSTVETFMSALVSNLWGRASRADDARGMARDVRGDV